MVRVRGGRGLKKTAAPPQLSAAVTAVESHIICGKDYYCKNEYYLWE